MSVYRTILLLWAVFLQLDSVLANPIALPTKAKPHRGGHQRHQNRMKYGPVDASTVADRENREITVDAGVGDFVYSGVGGLMHMVKKEYGLRRTESFYWGPAGNPYANLTAFTNGKDVRVLSLERFQNVLQHAKCTPESVTFTFLKEVNFDTVQREWSWINDADEHYLVLVTENARCNVPDGDPTNRQPWKVSKATFDDETNTVVLTAEPRTWQNAFEQWHLKVSSQAINAASNSSLVKRWGTDEEVQFPLAADFSTDPIALYSDDSTSSTGSISCNPCYTTGGTKPMGKTLPALIHLLTLLPFCLQLWYPDGINVGDIVELGPALKIDLFGQLDSTTAKFDVFTAGVSMEIPSDSIAVLDFEDASQNVWQGWSPIFHSELPSTPWSAEMSMSASAGIETRIEFDVLVFDHGFLAGLALAAPSVGISASGLAAQGGVCGVSEASLGVEFGVNVGVELDFFVGAGEDGDLPNKMPIFATSYDLLSTCEVVASGAPPSPSSIATPGSVSVPSYPSGSAKASGSYTPAASSYPVGSSSRQQASPWPAYSSSQPAVISYYPTSSSQPAKSSYVPPASSYIVVPAASSSDYYSTTTTIYVPQSSYVPPAASSSDYYSTTVTVWVEPSSNVVAYSSSKVYDSTVVVYVSASYPAPSSSGW
ncbi:uncharacterized protein LTR77_001246 [Saxophila tyrrhenica]|uniref:Uncharacterized protein n=1 Tax=Saxophila tyrrhenica TaxID=1690608 RepID=A0AAV9PKA1_9PEZI|nr:hypothetical protein LTR77_001246 [Saxophila tyrrhenica]